MAETKQIQDDQIALWRDLRKENFQHWRAWGSWYSWGSPVGLGLFFIAMAIGFAILKWAVKL